MHRPILIALAGFPLAAAASAQIVLSEIHYNPDGTDDGATPTREWVELLNTSPTTVALSGWTIGNPLTGAYSSPLPPRLVLNPGAALVLTSDSAAFDAQWNPGGALVSRLQVNDFPALTNSPSATFGGVALRNAAGQVIDSVNYDDGAPWPIDSPDGFSIFARPEALTPTANDVGSNWLPASPGLYGGRWAVGAGGVQDHGSPGFVERTRQAPFAPSPDAAWSMVVLPDTQNYVKSTADRAIFTQMTQWVVNNRDAHGIQFVLHEGDIVNQNSQVTPTSGNQSGTAQWQNAKASMRLLDGVVPYAIVPGNHDYGTTNAEDRSTQFNDFFRQSDNRLIDPAFGGTLEGVMVPGELDNALHEFTAPDGRKMLVVAMEWGPRQVSVDWANRSVRQTQYADHTAVLLTHAYMHHDETRLDRSRSGQGGNPHSYATAPDTHDGEDLWREVVRVNPQFEMVFSGHIGGDGTGYLRSAAQDGHPVHQMLFDPQFETHGGNGWLRVVEFLEDGRTVRVRTFSPFRNLEKTDAANRFEFTVSPLLPGDYNDDGAVNAADYTVWRDARGRSVEPWSRADGDGDGLIGQGDYQVFRDHFGRARAGQATGVPEPGTLTGAIVVAALAGARRRSSVLCRCEALVRR